MRKSLSGNTRKQPEPPSQQKKQLKRSSSLRSHNQSALSNFWELPRAVVDNAPSRVQAIISLDSPKEAASDGRARLIKYPRNLPKRHASVSVSSTASTTGNQSQAQVVIESSDSSQEIECLTEPGKDQRPRRLASAADATPTPNPEPPRKRRLQKLPSVLESVKLDSSDDDFVEVLSKEPNNATSAFPPQLAVDNRKLEKPIDLDSSFGEDEIQVEFVSDRTLLNPPKGQPCLPSSPPLLRANSPTIRRFNSNGSQSVVLADETQGEDNDEDLSVSPPEAAADVLSGNTLTGGCMPDLPLFASGRTHSASTLVHTNSADNGKAITYCQAPILFTHSMVSAANKPHLGTNDDSAELSSDPISEFLTPTVTPKSSRAAPNLSELFKMAEPIGSMAISEDAHIDHMQVSEAEEDNRSITQWYKENLLTQKLDDGDEDDDKYNNDEDNNPLCGVLDNNSILDSESDGEAGKGEELRCVNRSTTASGKNASNKGKDRDDDDDEDGYSSPLEGFWDLRCSTQGSISERDMYMNQFAPSQRQASARKKDTQGTAMQPDFHDQCSTPKGRAGTSGFGGQSSMNMIAKCNTAPANIRGKSAVRPLVSSRPPRPVASRPVAVKPRANPPGYNHYADDPYLDVTGSMGWEGSGMSRFG
ncbi:hypothetical protein LPJ59_000971 [Coemansia sp. RSA 2399]|nr:hypothetical protein LPJ59_000971 [Coemansia sp. RSA 2399]